MQRLERRDHMQGKVLRAWLSERVMPAFAGRGLSFDFEAAMYCAQLHVPNQRPDRDQCYCRDSVYPLHEGCDA